MRGEGITGGRTENLEEVGQAGTGGHSQVQLAHLQTTASGAQVYLGVGWGGGHRVENIEQNFPSPPAKGRSPHQADGAGLWVLHPQRLFCPGLWRLRRGVVLVFGVTHGASPSQARMCQSREEAASRGMTPSNFIEAKAPEDSKRAGEKPAACPSFSLSPWPRVRLKKASEDLSSW